MVSTTYSDVFLRTQREYMDRNCTVNGVPVELLFQLTTPRLVGVDASRAPIRDNYAALPCCDEPARRLRKNFSTSRESVSAVEVNSPDAESTEAAAVFVSPIASRSEAILATR